MRKNRYLGDHKLARELYELMRKYPILSPHGHVDPKMLSDNHHFTNPVELLITPDHYITRMLHSQGISYESLSIPHSDATRNFVQPRDIWRTVAKNWPLFGSTPSRIWMEEIFKSLFDIDQQLGEGNSDAIFDQISEKLAQDSYKPQALFKRFNIEVLATTDAPGDSLEYHDHLRELDLGGRIIPTFRPDNVSDPARADWKDSIDALQSASGVGIETFSDLLLALKKRRQLFSKMGATATDHGVFSPQTLKLSSNEKERLFLSVKSDSRSVKDIETFRAVMLFEHGKMAAEDGLVMQLHPGSLRNYDQKVFDTYGPDRGFDIPTHTTYTKELQALLNEVGNHPQFRMVVFTLDESAYSRELAPLAGAYSGLRLGPPWWFGDSLNGMERWRDAVTETAGYYNTVGFIDDTRAFCSIPVRHDIARRFDSYYLACEVARDRLSVDQAMELAPDLAYNLSKQFFNL